MIHKDSYRGKKFFTAELLKWNELSNTREMPWKNEKDPYRIWISEIILQQTRVQQGLGYYSRFINKFPSVYHIADSAENDVFKVWEGLGYYSRCKNIIASAKYIVKELGGKFPVNFENILQLKGIGNYTASAIASFAYNQPYAVLDGNVFRVLSRFFGIFEAIDGKRKNLFADLAHELIDKNNPGIYNQAIMDFGAVICKPKVPVCNVCPLRLKCYAFSKNIVNSLPIKEKKIIRELRWLYYLLIQYQENLYIRKRHANDIWQNLNEFVLIETNRPISINELQKLPEFEEMFTGVGFSVKSVSRIYKQQLTHQTISGRFLRINVENPPGNLLNHGYHPVTLAQLDLLAFPKFITAYLED